MIAQAAPDSGVSALDVVTLIIAIAGFGLGVAGLVWNVVAHLTSGVRASVDFTCGYWEAGLYSQWAPAESDTPFASKQSGLTLFGVRVRNIGRLPVVVTTVDVGGSVVWLAHGFIDQSPRLPHTVDVSAQAIWFYAAEDIQQLVDKLGLAKPNSAHGPLDRIVASVGLGTGKTLRSEPISAERALIQLNDGHA